MQNRLDTDLWQVDYGSTTYIKRTPTKPKQRALADIADADLVMEMIGRGFAVMKLDDIAEKVK